MIREILDLPSRIQRAVARRKARLTAIKNGQEIFRQMLTGNGYKFVPAGGGFYYVYTPDKTQVVSYDLQVYYDPTLGMFSYLCGCPACSACGACKHGVALVLFLEFVGPIYTCALQAPEPLSTTAPRPTFNLNDEVYCHGEGMQVGSSIYHPVDPALPQFAGYQTVNRETTNCGPKRSFVHGGYGN